MERTWMCEKCGRLSSLNQGVEKLKEDIEHTYFECQHCQNKVTIYYSDKKLRKMIKKQSKEKNNVIKQASEKIIARRMEELKQRIKSS